MRIILDCRSLTKGQQANQGTRFLAECLVRLLNEEPGWECFFLVNDASGPFHPTRNPGLQGPALEGRKIPAASLPGRWRWLPGLAHPLASLVKKYGADLFIGRLQIGSRHFPDPFGIVLEEGWMKTGPGKLNRKTQRDLVGAAVIFTGSLTDRESLIRHFSFASGKVVALQGVPDETFLPLSRGEKESVKAQYTGDKEYFIMTQACSRSEDLTFLLKAFAIFKKKQRSNMQLIVTGATERTLQDFSAKRETFKYREDLHFLGPLTGPDQAKLVGASYGLLQPFRDGMAQSLLNAFQAGVPVIAGDQERFREFAGEAALYIDGIDPESLAAEMIQLYTNENLRNGLIERVQIRIQSFGWEGNLHKLKEGISRAIQRVELNHNS
jgi:glycosyltransferase involved in cell wall biosynthesis